MVKGWIQFIFRFWDHFSYSFWSISGSFQVHFRSIFGPFSVYFRSIFGPFLVYFLFFVTHQVPLFESSWQVLIEYNTEIALGKNLAANNPKPVWLNLYLKCSFICDREGPQLTQISKRTFWLEIGIFFGEGTAQKGVKKISNFEAANSFSAIFRNISDIFTKPIL